MTEVLVVVLIIALLAAVFTPRYVTARDKGSFAACQENLKSIAVSLQSYANDNSQFYPTTLGDLRPRYIQTMPICPNAGTDSYSPSYEKNDLPAMFTIYCSGPNHLNIVPVNNQPFYVFGTGLGP